MVNVDSISSNCRFLIKAKLIPSTRRAACYFAGDEIACSDYGCVARQRMRREREGTTQQ
jgi:hypothetical protein